jgi:hypothetical protein
MAQQARDVDPIHARRPHRPVGAALGCCDSYEPRQGTVGVAGARATTTRTGAAHATRRWRGRDVADGPAIHYGSGDTTLLWPSSGTSISSVVPWPAGLVAGEPTLYR